MTRSFASVFSAVGAAAVAVAALFSSVATQPAQAQAAPPPARTAFVHLFEWKWTDIAKECETFLGPKGFAAVQVSPPNEHNWVATGDGAPFPWWMRYQPVGYSLDTSRSGNRAQFVDMVNRCNAVGVSIYVDAIINHMSGGNSGTSSAGNAWTAKNYPRVPYGTNDFHTTCGINNYNDSGNVQNCELSGLQDLNTGNSYVRGKIADYMVDLVNIGVKGFRIDAAKHMSPTDVGAIMDAVNGRVTNKPYWFLEVIGAPGEAVQPSQYQGLNAGTVNITEFKYGKDLHGKFTGAGGGKLADLQTFGPSYGLLPSAQAVAFTDNHDNQRGHGGSGNLTYHYGATYDLANVFMLAWPYGYPALMSSFAFNKNTDYDKSFGPPYNAGGSTKGPWDGGVTAPTCFNQTVGGWVCEHRYRPIANMVGFRNAVNGNWSVSNWWSNGNNQIAFGRGNLGFVVINKEGSTLSRSFATGLPAGKYCDVISGEFNATANTCSGDMYTVDASGNTTITVEPYKAAALHAGAKFGAAPTPPSTSNVRFTVQNADPSSTQSVYVVGNVAALGAWDACSAVKLSADNGAHSALVSVPAATAVQYKFIKHAACASPTWEGGSNRAVTSPAANGNATVCGVFNSTAACSVASTGNATVTFNVVASTVMGQGVSVVGSVSALGSWAPASAVAMTVVPGTGSGQSNTWRVAKSLPANTTLEYKYVKKDSAGAVIWESGTNRVVNTPQGGQGSTLNDTWK